MVFQTFSRLHMNHNVLRFGALLLKLLLFLPLPLLSQGRAISTLTIPLALSTGNHTQPAGDYVIHRVPEFTYSLNATRGTAVQYVSSYHNFAISAPHQANPVFSESGARYFLSDPWFDGPRDGIEVRMGPVAQELLASARGSSKPGMLLAVDMGTEPQE
jgi:hypothetical protein